MGEGRPTSHIYKQSDVDKEDVVMISQYYSNNGFALSIEAGAGARGI
jgi:hypothetical protein